MKSDFDSAWKTALDEWIEPFIEFFFPRIHGRIDWSRPPQFLEQELQKIQARDKTGRLSVDKLVRVWRKDGRETWVLIHTEVQSQTDRTFPLRMYRYSARIWAKYKRFPVSLAILGDETADWRPNRFTHRRWGCRHDFQFLSFKLLDLAANPELLRSHPNVFATIAEAHLTALVTRQNAELRLVEKVRLVRRLYERGLSEENIRKLFNVIDFLIDLPRETARTFREIHHQIEEERNVRRLTQSEELAKDEARVEMLLVVLKERFGSVPTDLEERLQSMDGDQLTLLVRAALSAKHLSDFIEHVEAT